MIGFVVAMNSEAKVLFDIFENEVVCTTPFKVYSLSIGDKQHIMVVSGVGKVNAAAATQYLLDKFSPDVVFNYGVVGGVYGQTQLGNVYVVDKCVQYDFDLSEVDDVAAGTLPDFATPFIECDTKFLTDKTALEIRSLATGDRFTTKQEISSFIKENFDCSLRDMEGAAIAQVCAQNKIPCHMLKGISDYVGEYSVNMFEVYSAQVLEKLTEVLQRLFVENEGEK